MPVAPIASVAVKSNDDIVPDSKMESDINWDIIRENKNEGLLNLIRYYQNRQN